jgi:HD-like signal output (HDOD) protein
MSAVMRMFFGSWWARFFGRAAEPAPNAVEAPEVPAVEPRPRRAVPVVRPSPEAAQKALADTVRGEVDLPLVPLPAEELSARREQTLAAMANLQQIPALQSLAQNFLRTLNQVDVDVADVVQVLAKDSALCVRILRMANSVAVGSERRIDDLESAVQMLGIARVRKAAQSMVMLRDSHRVTAGFDWRHLWMHAIATAAIADELEKRLRGEEPPALHVAALLHDVGKIVLSTVAADEYRRILVATWHEQGQLEELELDRLGVDHREAGRRFAEHAKLPDLIAQAIAHHDRPEEAESHRFEVALIAVANHISKAHGLGFSGARLTAADDDFAALPAWRVIEAELGRRPKIEEIEAELPEILATVRGELRELNTQR